MQFMDLDLRIYSDKQGYVILFRCILKN